MLSGECAMGKYPVECVEDMVKISTAVEGDINYWKRFQTRGYVGSEDDLRENVAYTSCEAAKDAKADAIVVYTETGRTAEVISSYRPACPIIALTDNVKTYHKLSLDQGVVPVYVAHEDSEDEMIGRGITKLENDGILEKDDKIVIAGGNKILPLEKESKVLGGIMRI